MGDLSRIELLVLDVDGVLTDGRLYIADDGREMKAFSIQDGAGLRMLSASGIKVAVISGHASEAVRFRLQRLGITEFSLGSLEKRRIFDDLLARLGLDRSRVAVIGDDIMDLPFYEGTGFRATVPGAHPDVLKVAEYVTRANGGAGAVREVADIILKARGLYDSALRRITG